MEPAEILQNLAILPQVNLSNSLIGEGRFVEAMKPLKELVANGNHRGYIYLAMGDIYRYLGRENISCNDEAKKFYNIAINLAEIEEDNQVIVGAKSGLAWIAIREAQDTFNALPDFNKWKDLHEALPFCLEPQLVAFAFLGEPCSCPSPDTWPRKNGRKFDGNCVRGGCREV